MSIPDISAIAEQLDKRAGAYSIGRLQEVRKALKSFTKRPGSTIFSEQTIKDHYAFHHGGRTELQYNIGRDGCDERVELRHGVAFSLELSQALPSIDVLVPKIKLFNDYIRLYAEQFGDMRMWHFNPDRSDDYAPTVIPPNLVEPGVFIFLGKHGPTKPIDYGTILQDFDRLLPLYRYVESGGAVQPVVDAAKPRFSFKPGCVAKQGKAKASLAERELDLDLRHNALQRVLHDSLAKTHGADNVGTEIPTGNGTQIDVVLRQGDGYSYYEIKTALTPRGCIREALGQLLEYSFWPGATAPARMIVVGEAPLDKSGEEYLERLRKQFSLQIYYEQIVAP